MRNRRIPAVYGILILGILVFLYLFNNKNEPKQATRKPGKHHGSSLNRDKHRLVYSKHARCRMACRNIDSSEVIEILEEGSVNYHKTDTIQSRDPKFALEGRTHDGQQVRIVFAMAGSKTVVVTVIDLDQDIECSCR
jgi:hypothetical protein